MSFILGSVSLPRPKAFRREYVEQGATVRTLDNTTKKDYSGRKEKFTLEFKMLTQTQIGQIVTEFELNIPRNFSVSETNLTISATPVLIEIISREYNTPGIEYREDLVLELTEVS